MAGHLISLYFKELGYNVVGFARSKSRYLDNTILGDACEISTIGSIIKEGEYDAVINCLGILNQFAEENKSTAVLINGYIPHYLTKITQDSATRVIHMSTDCVFAGNDGPYFEYTLPNGTSFYDRTKAIGEINTSKDLTFRNSIVGPDLKEQGIGLFNWFMKQSGTIYGYTGAMWTGVTTITLAKAMGEALNDELAGIYNLVNNESISKFDLLSLFNRYFRNNSINILPNGDLQLDKSLRNTRGDFSFVVPSYEKQIQDMHDWIKDHASLYPHYK